MGGSSLQSDSSQLYPGTLALELSQQSTLPPQVPLGGVRLPLPWSSEWLSAKLRWALRWIAGCGSPSGSNGVVVAVPAGSEDGPAQEWGTQRSQSKAEGQKKEGLESTHWSLLWLSLSWKRQGRGSVGNKILLKSPEPRCCRQSPRVPQNQVLPWPV